jgi:cysteinyl-tRNA synthetase
MRITDSLQKEKIEMDLDRNRVVRMFVCGPTVQDRIHIGHARTYIFFDVLARYLRSRGYDVFYLQNITDVDDRIINKSMEEKVPPEDLAARNLQEYLKTLRSLGINSVNFYARATLFMDEITDQVGRLLRSGHAYRTEDGVYFRISSFPEFGRLSGQSIDSLISGARISPNENKEDYRDFVIWKLRKEGEPYWGSPFGDGRPGWHIEDTSITESFFGPSYDIHGGGADLQFPHHEAEIAIERSISGRSYLARFWIHTGMVNIKNEKMSKSLGNSVTVADILKSFSGSEVRLAMLKSGYRSTIDFSFEMLEEAKINARRLSTMYMKLKNSVPGKGVDNFRTGWIERMQDSLEDDMDTRGAITTLNEFASYINSTIDDLSIEQRNHAIAVLQWASDILGIVDLNADKGSSDSLIEGMVDLRNQMRKKKDFHSADLIREKLREGGVYIEDRGDSTIWWKE